MNTHPISEMMETTIEQIRQMADTNTIVGNPVYDKDGITIIPVSKVAYGFASGGSDFASKNTTRDLFGGGGGAGITITPLSFIVIANGDVKLLDIATADNTADRALNLIPGIVDKLTGAFSKAKDKSKKGDTPNSDISEDE